MHDKKQIVMSASYFYIICSVIILIFTMSPVLLLCKYAHPQNIDNYILFRYYQEKRDMEGLASSCFHDFIHSVRPGKRFSSFFSSRLFLMLPKTLTVENIATVLLVYRLYALSIIVLFLFSLFFLTYQCNKYFINLAPPELFFLWSLLLYIIMNSIVRIDFFLYEMTLSTGYTVGLCLFFLYTGLLIRYYHTQKNLVTIRIVSAVILFLLCATIEYFPVLAGYTTFIFLILYFIKYKRIEPYILLLFIYCLIAFTCFIFEPSNSHKVKLYSGGIQNPYTIPRFLIWFTNMNYELKHVFIYLLQFRIFPLLIIISSLIKKRININVNTRFFVLFICMNYIICYLMGFSIFIAGLLDFKNNATIQIPYQLMIINTLLLFVMCISKYRITRMTGENIFSFHTHDKKLKAVFCLIAYIGYFSVVTGGLTVRQAWKDILKGTAYTHDKQMRELYNMLKNTPEDIITISEINTTPQSLRAQNLWSSEGNLSLMQDYANGALETFFNKKSIIIEKVN